MQSQPERIINFITDFEPDPSGSLGHQAKRCLLDELGSLLAGAKTPVAELAARMAMRHLPAHGREICSIPGGTASLLGAALANGFASNALDVEHGYRRAQGRPGSCLLPVMLPLAQAAEKPIDGKTFLSALIIGYEVAMRAGILRNSDPLNVFTTGAWASLGAVAAGARLLDLAPETVWQALGCVDFHCPLGHVMQSVNMPNMAKDGIGWGSFLAMSSLFLAQQGLTSPAPIFKARKEQNPDCNSSCGQAAADSIALPELGEKFLVYDLYFKPYCACRWTHSALDAARAVMRKYAISVADIESVLVRTFHHAAALSHAAPRDSDQAQYNITWPMAAMIMTGAVGAMQVLQPALSDRGILEMQKRVRVEICQEYDRQFPKKVLSEVIIRAKGQNFSSGPVEPRWEASAPPKDEELEEKFLNLLAPWYDRKELELLINRIWNLENMYDCAELLKDCCY